MSSKLLDKYVNAIRNDELTEINILSLRKHLNGRFKSSLTEGDKHLLIELVHKHEPKITREQEKKGYRWLMDQYKTPKGRLRKNCPFGGWEKDILDNFNHFRLVGFYDVGNYSPEYLPVYCVVATNGNSFKYVPHARQNTVHGDKDQLEIVG